MNKAVAGMLAVTVLAMGVAAIAAGSAQQTWRFDGNKTGRPAAGFADRSGIWLVAGDAGGAAA